MSGGDTPFEERHRSAAGVFAKVLCQSVKSGSGLPGKWRDDEVYNRAAIDAVRSRPILEFRLAKWPPRYRLSIHSDDGSLVGYGVFRPSNMNRTSNDQGLPEHLAARVLGGRPTSKHWAWYREMDEPLRDFSRQETWIEVEKIRRGEKSKGDDAFRRASDDLVKLAEALDGWYSEG